MSTRHRSPCHGQFDTSIAPRELRRRSPLPCEIENSRFEKPAICRNGPPGRGSGLRNTERRETACCSRRPFFDAAHLQPSMCSMAHLFSKTRISGRKRSLDYSEFEMAKKKRKPFNLNSDPASAKSKHSKEMVSHKYRTVDSIQRSGVSNANCVEKQKVVEPSDTKSRRSSRINKDEFAGTPEMKAVGLASSLSSHREGRSSSFEGSPEDWTQEHLREPRKVEKRKSLDELQATESAWVMSWTKKARRQLRKGDKGVNAVSKTLGTHKFVEHNACPEEEMRKSLSSSERLKLASASESEGNEQACSKHPSKSKKGYDLTANGSGHIKDTLDVSSLQPLDSNRMDVLNGDHDAFCCSQDHPVLIKPPNNSVLESQEGKPLATLKEDNRAETLVECEKEEVRVCRNDTEVGLNTAEGRRCGLCGGDSRGEPPTYLLPVSTKQKSGQSTESDQTCPGYSEWDAFGNEPGWLGPLLGPLDDRFGIAGVWVHQECAIWSPEVYFAGLGHIKNIRAALRRGKLLKCTRCTRAGATIGCRIKRCPRTYHLPCARFEGCFFDHKRFLMACDEHLHHFLPRLPGQRQRRNSLNLERIRFKRKVAEWKKSAQKIAQLDAEAEDKWQEKAGVDEEFLRRERKRFERDIARVAPVMVGGGGEQHTPEGWESIAGSDNVVQCMKEMVILPLLYPEAFTRLGVSPPRGVLLHGHPGTGKTLAVKALVGACARGHTQIAYFARKGADCLGKYAGDAERQLRMLFYLAEKHQPSIIFFDEIDGLAPMRSQHQDQTQKSVVSTLLALMDGIKSRGSVVVIGATNRPDALDPALRRPGRFDREIYFPLPSFTGRAAILTLLTKSWQLPEKDDTISLLASQTIGFAGADLQALCAQAAINSLTRTVSVETLMTIVEQQGISKKPPFPDLCVNNNDWVNALEQVSPPCSWRSAKAAVNTVKCAPAPCHSLPVLLWPMVELLVLLHLDDRTMLPPMLDKVATQLEEVLKVNLGGFWIDHIDSFFRDIVYNSYRKRLEQDLEKVFTVAGMVSYEKVKLVMPNVAYTGSKFHVMVSGKERSWLDHLAAWLLYGFEGFVEMCNLNLMTMLQEGGGDVVQGLIHILDNVRHRSPCVVYMPQMESWALEPVAKNSGHEPVEEQRQASHFWNIFLQQVNLLPASLQVVFLASTRMQKAEFPLEIVEFFAATSTSSLMSACNSSGGSSLQETWQSFYRSSPGLWVEAFLVPDMKKIFRRAANDFAELLCQKLLYHDKSGNRTCTTESPNPSIGVLLPGKLEVSNETSLSSGSMENGHDHAEGRDIGATVPIVSAPHSNGTGPNNILQEDLTPVNNSETRSTSVTEFQPSALHSPDQNPMSVAISMVGHQLLYHPELKELRHATSNLREGPSFTTKPCAQKASSESTDSSNSLSEHVNLLEIRGLNAVGLLAYSGKYLKAIEVAWGVREVLDLLTKRIDVKVNLGKDREQFSHLLHQAASLEDKIFLWAYNICRCEVVSRKMGTPREGAPQKLQAGGGVSKVPVGTPTIHEKELKAFNSSQDPLSPQFTSVIEDLNGNEVSPQVLHSKESDHCQSGEMQHNVLQVQRLANHKFQPKTMNANQNGVTEMHINSASRKCCPYCLHQTKQALRKLFKKSWRCKGSEISLDVADEVIGTCSSMISTHILNSNIHQGHFHRVTSSRGIGCSCRSNHKQTRDAPCLSSKDTSSNRESLITTEQEPGCADLLHLKEAFQELNPECKSEHEKIPRSLQHNDQAS